MRSMGRNHRESAHTRHTRHARTYLMCPPEYFTVEYAINPWMNPGDPVDLPLAKRQWERLRSTYVSLGHTVHIIDAEPGLPDMVFAANGATVIGGNVLGSRFKHPERHPEGAAYMDWFRRKGYRVVEPDHVNEGEGDIVFAGETIIAGYPGREHGGLLSRGVRRGRAGGAGGQVPRVDRGQGRRCRDARPERAQRRPERRDARAGGVAGGRDQRGRVHGRARRHVRVQEGRRRPEVLHAGTATSGRYRCRPII